ncbi:HAMP domain-containing sensor histidine kinase [Paenisporosarcina sp. TG-14]|uniref:HAMP domain-containing sensor histidine kinase n=1 Tax=Paenisporosarcina sp. TG-14 TaxID=1231057 RepID=UPI000365CA1E|nr:ATP-binding protein [Paenisporosarcina sp. TG-14]
MNQIIWWKRLIASQSLKKKWAFSSATVIFLSFATMSIILFVALKGWLYHQEEQEVNRTMVDLMTFFESQGHFLTVQDIQANTGLMTSIVNKNQTIRLLNIDGIEMLRINKTSTFQPFNSIDFPSKGYLINTGDSSSITAVGIVKLGRFNGYVQLEHPLTSFQSIITYILTAMLLFSLCALLLSGWIGYILASYLLKPLQDLKVTMDDVVAHGFEKDLAISYDAKDEIGELIDVYASMMAKLKSSFEQQQQFIADASHELRTPIQVVEGHLALLNRWGKYDPVVLEESLGISLREVNQMKNLIDEMLELARGEQIKERPPTNIVEYTIEVIKELSQIHPSTNIEHILPASKEMQVPISSNAYQQIIRNILSNAIRYSKSPAHVCISYKKTPLEIIVNVKDHGIGIAPQHVLKIFDRFYRVDSVRTRNLGGSGLGLSIVKMLIENASGSIHVLSEEGKGSTFSMVFPLFFEDS